MNRDLLARQLLEEAQERFDMEEVGTNEEIHRLLFEIQNIADKEITPEVEAVPTVENDFGDPAFINLTKKINTSFSSEFLRRCLISRITIRPDIIHIAIGKGLYLTREEYERWLQQNPRIDEFKVRAENFTTFQTSGWLRDNFYINENVPLPIIVYGFNDNESDNIDHLSTVAPEIRESTYRFGTVVHEIGHHIFQFILTPEQKEEFILLAKKMPAFTEYSRSYKDKDLYAEEQFCEAIRLIITNPTYLKETAPEVYSWLSQTLPDIHQGTT